MPPDREGSMRATSSSRKIGSATEVRALPVPPPEREWALCEQDRPYPLRSLNPKKGLAGGTWFPPHYQGGGLCTQRPATMVATT
jgi:hypothetical protein